MVSLIVQGLTLEPLARFAGITRPADARHEETLARLRLAEAALARLEELADDQAAPDTVIDRARASLQARIGQARPAPRAAGRSSRTASPNGNCAASSSALRTPNSAASTRTAPSPQTPGSDSSAASTWKSPASATTSARRARGTAAMSKILASVVMALTAVRFYLTGTYELSASAGWKETAGITGLILAAVALYAGLAFELEDSRRATLLPTLRHGPGLKALAGDLPNEIAGVQHEAGVGQKL